MKILAVGYACSPVGGSEPGVGWTAVCRIARNHEVWVLTDIHNKDGWNAARIKGTIPGNVHVRFLRGKSSCSQNRFIAHAQSWWNYRAFNRLVLEAALAWHREIGFDLCHQVTIASWRMPSPLWRLPVPFVWGPIGGAGYIPPAFRSMLSPSARVFECIRDVQTAWSLRSTPFRQCMSGTSVVFAANEETENLLRPHRQGLPMFRLPIASISEEKADRFRRPADKVADDNTLRLFAGGNIEGRKAVSLAVRALAKVKASGVSFQYTVAGGGPEIPALMRLSRELGLEREIIFHPGYKGQEYIDALHRSDVYFLPSFRESTPVTLLEACLAGCYPVVADTSAQGEIIRMVGGHAVATDTMEGLIGGLADSILWCSRNRSEMVTRAQRSVESVARLFSSERYDSVLCTAYDSALAGPPPIH